MQVIKRKNIIKTWAEELDEKTMEQVYNLSDLPFMYHHVAIMPDAHMGYGMPIGGVLATKGVVIPNAVGVDIGCGMCAMHTPIGIATPDSIADVVGRIQRRIPVGFNKHRLPQSQSMPRLPGEESCLIAQREWGNACLSLGTLGGGNHFIELQTDKSGGLWAMIHSGSRNLGKQVADHYNKVACTLNAKWHTRVPVGHDLAFLPLDTPEAEAYLEEMNYCVAFALANRHHMMAVVKDALTEVFGDFDPYPIINIAHNYARMEHHFGCNVMVHRKGATSAKSGEVGIIPGSQGTSSFIVKGRGNTGSFKSCSHGAGRRMGRKQACRELDLDEQKALLDSQGILHSIRGKKDLDEAPGAYKDIHDVMERQRDLVDIVEELHPLAVVKG